MYTYLDSIFKACHWQREHHAIVYYVINYMYIYCPILISMIYFASTYIFFAENVALCISYNVHPAKHFNP